MPEARPTVDLLGVRAIGAGGAVAFCLAAAMAWRAGDGVVAVLFLVFASLGLHLLLGAGVVAADSTDVTVSSVLGRYRMAWQHVRRIERSPHGTLVLHGEDARLVVPPPLFWSGPDKQALHALIAGQIRARSLVVERSRFADYRTHSNVRVRAAMRD